MSKHAHTPAPWAVDAGRIKIEGRKICGGPDNRTLAAVRWYCSRTGDANARLIAAAPDMLKALRKAEAILEDVVASSLFPPDDPSDRVALDAVQDAIAKAKGGK